MKKGIKTVYAGILILTMLLGLAGCGAGGGKQAETTGQSVSAEPSESAEQEEDQNEKTVQDGTTDAAQDVLVVYFSRTGEQYGVGEIDKGNTAIVADMIIDQTGADSFEILPEEDYYPYTYDELTDVAKQEQNENARPAYAGEVPDLTQYSTVFIGAPVWWGDWPMIMYTFFENNADALAGKTLIPFSTHAGSGLSGFDQKLSSACPDSTVGEGLAVEGTDAQNDQDSVRDTVNEWLTSLGY